MLSNVNGICILVYVCLMYRHTSYMCLTYELTLCFLFPLCRVGQAGSPLCNMPESRHKDCQPREAQRVGTNEGTFTFPLY